MAQITSETFKDKDLTVLKVSGELTAGQLINSLEEFYRSDFTSRLLWDFSETDLRAATREHIEEVLAVAKRYAPLRKDGRTAILAPNTLDYGIARMYEIISENKGHPVSHSVFRDRDEAMRWLTSAE